MAETKGRKISRKLGEESIEFAAFGEGAVNSPVRVPKVGEAETEETTGAAADPANSDEKIYSPEFLELAVPKLPVLRRGNRARLLMQTPNRLYFYWSIGKNPFHTLSRALGEPGSYTLVLRLIDLKTGREQINAVEQSGNWWFDVDADAEYRAEIGFYAVNRPYIRILYSNTVATPRKSPSPRTADTAEWYVPAEKFAKVLDAAGFQRDAFDVALAGDDAGAANTATLSAFAQFSGRRHADFADIESSELRYALFALASGIPLAELRGLVSERLFSLLSAIVGVSPENALAALKDRFEFDAEEFEIEEDADPVIFGSRVGFPRRLKTTRRFPDLPGSHSVSSRVA